MEGKKGKLKTRGQIKVGWLVGEKEKRKQDKKDSWDFQGRERGSRGDEVFAGPPLIYI